MLYHVTCEGNEAREFGWPMECVQAFSDGTFEYRCMACNALYLIHIEDEAPASVYDSSLDEAVLGEDLCT